jgi:hypothetical protein
LTPERGNRSLELATSLLWFWLKRGYFREGQAWMERALSVPTSTPPAIRAKALMCLGSRTFFQGDFGRTRTLMKESAAIGRTAGDISVAGFALGIGALAALEAGDIAECARLAADGQAAARASVTPWAQGPSLACLAYLAMGEGDYERAGRPQEEVLELSRQQGDTWGMGIVLFDLALLRVVQHRHAEARALCTEGIVLCREFGDRRGIAWCLGILSAADGAEGHALRAARLRGAMEGLLESLGAPIQPSFHRWIGDRHLDALKQSLGDTVLQAASAAGRAMSLTQAIEFGLEVATHRPIATS